MIYSHYRSVEGPAQSLQICGAIAEALSSDINSPNQSPKLPNALVPTAALPWAGTHSLREPYKSVQSTSGFVQALDPNARRVSVGSGLRSEHETDFSGFDIEIRGKF